MTDIQLYQHCEKYIHKDYALLGTKSENKKYIGNAVECGMARQLCKALYAACAI